ncbi:methyl-accepting chemotaxis protein [Sutcliffiella cohnii]|uniref:methyl-accepting chemotaxis protein n=1 Tax=Sutcliffiella cohnii TaxID=33932 RepID=UPI002E1DD232|nr:methyl-accepting chemotaxis protein [Sutcliffiella cohnii]
MSIKKKLFLLAITLGIIGVLASSIIWVANTRVETSTTKMDETALLNESYFQLYQSYQTTLSNMYHLLSTGYSIKHIETVEGNIQASEQYFQEFENYFLQYEELAHWQQYFSLSIKTIDDQFSLIRDVNNGANMDRYRVPVSEQLASARTQLERANTEIMKFLQTNNELERTMLVQTLQTSNSLIFAVMVVIVLLPMIALLSFGRSLTKGINQLMKRVRAYQEGNFELELLSKDKRGDEFGQVEISLTEMGQKIDLLLTGSKQANEKLQQVMVDLIDASERNIGLSSTIKDQSTGATEKVAAQYEGTSAISAVTEEASASTEEIYSIVDEMKNNLKEMNTMSEKGSGALNEVAQQMQKFTDDTEKLVQQFELITDSIEAAQTFLANINEITNQTNLLALNASIEAARAGEAGKGFAVVATEIRKLSKQTDEFANEIKQIIGTVAGNAKEISTEFLQFKGQLQHTNEQNKRSSSIFNQIAVSSGNLLEQGSHITVAMEEISLGVTDIVHSVNDLVTSSADATKQMEQVVATTDKQVNISYQIKKTSDLLQETSNQLEQNMRSIK